MKSLLLSITDNKQVWKNFFEEDKLVRLLEIGEPFIDFSEMEPVKISLYGEIAKEEQEVLMTLEINLNNKGSIITINMIEVLSEGIYVKMFGKIKKYIMIGGQREGMYKVVNGVLLRHYLEEKYSKENTRQITNLLLDVLKMFQTEYLVKEWEINLRGPLIIG